MKRVILTLILFFLFGTPAFASEITVTDKDVMQSTDPDDFLPFSVKEILSGSEIDLEGQNLANSVLGFAVKTLKGVISEISPNIGNLLLIIIFISVFNKIIDNNKHKLINSYIVSLVLAYQVFGILKNILSCASATADALHQMLSAILPAFSAVLLMGGSTVSSALQSVSFGTVLVVLESVVEVIILPLTTFMALIVIVERISPQFSELGLLKSVKKNVITVITFITMILLTVISYQNIISAGKDSVSARTVKFAAANFIPIIGAAFGESLRTVGAGLKYLKNTVGAASGLSVAVTALPFLIRTAALKISLNFLSFISGLTDCQSARGLFESVISILDILNAIIICIMVLSFLLIISFTLASFPITS